jgi:hypothetical protein
MSRWPLIFQVIIRSLFQKISGHVPMAFDDVDHFEAVFDVAEEDHVVLKGGAAKIGSQFRRSLPISNGSEARWSQ